MDCERRPRDPAVVQERLTLALSVAKAGSWDYNVTEGRVFLDEAAENLLGISGMAASRSPSSLLNLVHRQDRVRVLKQLRSLHATQDVLETSFRLQDQQGEVCHIAIRGRVVSCTRRGHPLQTIGIGFDITDHKALEEQLLIMAMHDPLTGVRNRRSFDQLLRQEWKLSNDLQRSLAVLMIDVDQFKLYNDKHGHLAGDEVLCSVARVLSKGLQRAGGLVARYGGEEFVVLLPGASSEQAALIADRLLSAVRALQIQHPSSLAGIVTASIGVAAITPNASSTSENLLKAADTAMYRAKTTGRNVVST